MIIDATEEHTLSLNASEAVSLKELENKNMNFKECLVDKLRETLPMTMSVHIERPHTSLHSHDQELKKA